MLLRVGNFFCVVFVCVSLFVLTACEQVCVPVEDLAVLDDYNAGLVSMGFFSPAHVDHFVDDVESSILNLRRRKHIEDPRLNLRSLKDNLDYVESYGHRINLDLGSIITDSTPPEDVVSTYLSANGVEKKKVFSALPEPKLRRMISNEEIERRLEGLPSLVRRYRSKIGIIFLVDEPYLNGIPPSELDRAIDKLKEMFLEQGVTDLRYGAIFASALYNADFAKFINENMLSYVESIDNYYLTQSHLLQESSVEGDEFRRWHDIIENHRLTTYDQANNAYLEGGLPEGLDVVGFDYYLSTTLMDVLHNDALAYFHSLGMQECESFLDVSMIDLKQKLSFFKDGSVSSSEQTVESDKDLLDQVFNCRMSSAVALLKQEMEELEVKPSVLLIGESGANGVYEFDALGNVEPGQPAMLVELRVFNEVKRNHEFYLKNMSFFDAGLYYFLFQDAYDESLNLGVGGVASYASVLDYIYKTTRRPASVQCGNRLEWYVDDVLSFVGRYLPLEDYGNRLEWYIDDALRFVGRFLPLENYGYMDNSTLPVELHSFEEWKALR